MRKKRIIIGTLSIFIIWGVFSFFNKPTTSNGYNLVIIFDDANGLKSGADVRLSGVKIGEVIEKKLNSDYQAEIIVRITSSILFPDDSTAFIQTESLFGDKYIQTAMGGSEDFLEDGDEFEYTQGAADIEALARKIIQQVRK